MPPAPAATWCTQRAHAFCADFDGAKAKHGWESIWYGGAPGGLPGSGYELVQADRSAPYALSINEPAVASGETRGGPSFAQRVKVTSSKGARVNLDLRLDSIGIDTDTYAIAPVSLSLTRTEGSGRRSVAATRLDLRSTKTELHVGPPVDEKGNWHVSAEHLPRSRWVHVEITVDLGTTPASATMTYDGKQVAKGSYGALDPATIDEVSLEIGMTLHSPHANEFIATFDNVTLDTL